MSLISDVVQLIHNKLVDASVGDIGLKEKFWYQEVTNPRNTRLGMEEYAKALDACGKAVLALAKQLKELGDRGGYGGKLRSQDEVLLVLSAKVDEEEEKVRVAKTVLENRLKTAKSDLPKS